MPAEAQQARPRADRVVSPATLDVTGVTLSDVLRLYFGHIDPRPYAVCSEAVGDMRRVTVRAPSNLTFTALRAILDMHGYSLRERAGMLLVCGKDQMSGRGDVDIRPVDDGTNVYSARPQRRADALPAADTWGPPSDGSPLHRASDAVEVGDPVEIIPVEQVAVPPQPAVPEIVEIYRPRWRTPGEILPIIQQASLGRVLNQAASGGVPQEVPPAGLGGNVGTFLQTQSDYVAWKGTEEQWRELCPFVEAIDVPTPSIAADVYVFAVSTTEASSDGIAIIGQTAGLNFGVGATRSNSVGIGIGAAELVLSSVRTNDNVKLVQHYTAQLVNARRQLLNSGASVPITTDLVDLEGGRTRQSQEYRTVGTAVTIDPRILGSSVQLEMSIELSSVSSTRVSGSSNPTFNTERVQTTVHSKPNSVSFVSALAASSQSASREKFFFIPIGRSDELRKSDIVYMVVLHNADAVDDPDRTSVCPTPEMEDAASPARPTGRTEEAASSSQARSDQVST